ncbi:P-loop containing nucleoside triphosphate hydrolase protein [Phlyctochytrium arcticum]|nr:P-loop containing nucleoside triphosphate hydrolase protein [Phlyctochytrium arcticum]
MAKKRKDDSDSDDDGSDWENHGAAKRRTKNAPTANTKKDIGTPKKTGPVRTETPRTPLLVKTNVQESPSRGLKPFSASPGGGGAGRGSPLTKRFKVPTFVTGRPAGSGGLRVGTTLGTRARTQTYKGPLYDPELPNAIVLHHPKIISAAASLDALKSTKLGSKLPVQEVHVVVDPRLGNILRPHQIEGVRFLYQCVMGQVKDNAFGCIMADEMGLGKTLQCITLLWTLLKQSPEAGKPAIEKAVIACPSSLVKNWANELVKWLGENSIRPYACDNKGSKEQTERDMRKFVSDKGRAIVQPVLIVSYETLRAYSSILCQTEIGLLLCDEGHRLKNAESQTYINLNQLNAKRRVILSGTPIQNDLTEYFALLSFAIPDVLGSGPEFRKSFEIPILRGRDADASEKDRAVSNEKLAELLAIANKFIIRRTAELLTKYLPVKYEHVVFCKLTPMQLSLYNHFTQSKQVKNILTGSGSQPLKAITFLKKLCNHPALLDRKEFGAEAADLYPSGFDENAWQSEYSGKINLLERMLVNMRKTTTDKIVLISNYTQTLDLFVRMCQARKWGHLRLDGTMTIQKRQKLVDRFNDPVSPEFIFLLSSKAGGCGINLIGANRLVLFDPDWNPANDAQALARVWRDGQKKTCFIYRFIATGSIEEKIFQRQAHKQSLSSCVVDATEDVERHFSLENLRQLFLFNPTTLCDTHDTFRCKRCIKHKQIKKPPELEVNAGAGAQDTSTWNHYSELELGKVVDTCLKTEAMESKVVTYVFQNKSHEQQVVKLK